MPQVSSRNFDLILLDIIMEGMDGFQVVHQIRSLGTKIEDDPNHPQYLRTVRGVGYQFCAE